MNSSSLLLGRGCWCLARGLPWQSTSPLAPLARVKAHACWRDYTSASHPMLEETWKMVKCWHLKRNMILPEVKFTGEDTGFSLILCILLWINRSYGLSSGQTVSHDTIAVPQINHNLSGSSASLGASTITIPFPVVPFSPLLGFLASLV